jgi:hypothetical protein
LLLFWLTESPCGVPWPVWVIEEGDEVACGNRIPELMDAMRQELGVD